MKIVKIAFILTLSISFCSFAFYSNPEVDGREQLYNDFLDQFELVKVPKVFVLKFTPDLSKSDASLQKKKSKAQTVLGSKYADFLPEIKDDMMSRMGPSTYIAEVMLANNTKDYNTVIYSESFYSSYDHKMKAYHVATFDKNGTRISSAPMGYCEEQGQINITASVNMKFFIQEFDRSELGTKQLVEARHSTISITNEGKIVSAS